MPTLQLWDRLLINKLAYYIEAPERGDIVLFRDPEGEVEPLTEHVVGVPGDKIAVRVGDLLLNGQPQKESYVVKKTCVSGAPKTCSFGPGHQRIRLHDGDNRAHSSDSRFFGPSRRRP
ncbi:MAG TPA: signal peptidase I [Rubrobacter sp.]|nr:signal peptidase I [Rubrobacter sp.]